MKKPSRSRTDSSIDISGDQSTVGDVARPFVPRTPSGDPRVVAARSAMLIALDLAELRARRRLTQLELAGRLGVRQPSVSRLEHRDNLYLSTLREYVEALGGRLEVAAVFDDDRVLIEPPSEVQPAADEPATAGEDAQPGASVQTGSRSRSSSRRRARSSSSGRSGGQP